MAFAAARMIKDKKELDLKKKSQAAAPNQISISKPNIVFTVILLPCGPQGRMRCKFQTKHLCLNYRYLGPDPRGTTVA